jgi:hypothetical protein
MHLSYDQTIAFQAVAKHGSFSKAAEALFRSQSAVSIQVAKLEATYRQAVVRPDDPVSGAYRCGAGPAEICE